MKYTSVAVDEDGRMAIPPTPLFRQRRMTAGAVAMALFIGGAFLLVLLPTADEAKDALLDSSVWDKHEVEADASNSETLKVSNSYERLNGRAIGDGVYPHDYLVAVMKPTRLEFHSGSEADWYVHNEADGSYREIEKVGAAAATHVFDAVGTTRVRAVRSKDGHVYEFDVDARIVRYELRDLSDDDRERYFAALKVFYSTGYAEGAKKYGHDYMSLEYLVRQHLYGAADKSCDHWHDDAGIMNHHIGITWEMEQSLRMIDASVAAHYWDYTREDAVEKNQGDDDASTKRFWWESAVFRDDWFGSNSPANGDHIVASGRWAYTSVMADARAYSDITNPYGLLRSPWNANPTPYLMRYNRTFSEFGDADLTGFPECDQGFVKTYFNHSLAKVLQGLNGELHGPVHIMVGGHWNFKSVWKDIDAPGDVHLLLSKFMWRQGFVRVPEVCSADTPRERCMPSCPAEIRAQYSSAEALLEAAGVVRDSSWSTLLMNSTFESTTLTYDDLLDELCHVGYAGEMFTSAAPQDPLFWSVHGNAERFLQALRWYQEEGFISGFDQTWGYDHVASASDTNVVCDWSGVSSSTDMPSCTKGTCPGHKADDTLPFTHLQWASGTKSGVISNTEMYERIAPQNKDMPYVYDAVLYWEGCKGESLYVSAARQKVVSERYGHDEAPSSTTHSIEGVHGSSS